MDENIQAQQTQEGSLSNKNSKLFPVLLALFSILALLFIGTFLIFKGYRLPGERTVPTPSPLPTQAEEAFTATWNEPVYYLATNTNGEMVLGNLKGGDEVIIAKSKGKILGSASFHTRSQSGKYVVYIQLPDEIVRDFQKNPPYEYYGSSDYEIHLVTINGDEVTDTLVDTDVSSFIDPTVSVFDKNEKGFYYPKYENEKDVTYYYDITSGQKSQKPLPDYLEHNVFASPSYTRYVTLETLPRDPAYTGINDTYNLFLVTLPENKKELLYKEFISGEQSLLFPSDTMLYLTREDYVDGPNSTCYIEMISFTAKQVTELEKKECPPGFNETNYHELSLSPDKKLLVAEYAEQGPSNQTGTGSFFIYNLETKQKRTIAEAQGQYGKYFWVSPQEFVVNKTGDSPKVLRVNIQTGEVAEDTQLTGKTIYAVL